jgi:parvulin-like peptidyl-prolyl isomerase
MRVYKLMFSTALLIIIILICLPSCGTENKDAHNIVAKIGKNYTITFNDLRNYVYDWSYDKMYRNKSEAYTNALDAMITNQLKRIDFFTKGLDKDDKLIQSIRRTINEELVIEYYTTKYVNKYSSEEYARKIYSIMDKEVVYRQILLKVHENASKKQLESIKQKAMEIKAEIDNGKDFSQLVTKYSQDSSSLNTNGYKPPVGWEQSVLDPIGEIIFKLNVGDVKVLFAYDGYHIVNIADIKKVDLEPFEKIKNNIIAKLKNLYTDRSFEEFEKDKKTLLDEKSIKWNGKALSQLSEWSKIPRFYLGIYKDTIQNSIDSNNFTILTYSEGQIDLKEFLRLLNEVLIPNSPEKIKVEDFKTFILEAIRTDKVVKKAQELGLEKNIFNSQTTNPVLKNQIAILYNQAVIGGQVPEASDEILHNFYEEQKDSLYYKLEKVNIYVMVYRDKEKADEVMQQINKGAPFEKITGRWFVKTYVKNRDGSFSSYMSIEKPFLAEAAFKLKLFEVVGPIEYYDPEKDKQFAVIKCVGLRPEKQLAYDDVKNTIVADYRSIDSVKIFDRNIKELKNKYGVEIYEDVLVSKLKAN